MISVVFLAHLVTLVDTGKMCTYVRIPVGLDGDNSSLACARDRRCRPLGSRRRREQIEHVDSNDECRCWLLVAAR